ncbi:MAG: gamma-glutamyl-gamma-aminobutyrate hydrolase family protein [Bacteroidetes bacterium]|nr:gamma-glutamyl-gamma-aminobutyrate hydrolase family protein [Bacteroidota bacterium]MCL5027350.1 gamma-glutamyl-gamma-aminobutyrate hydrolase family protein [Chloroflexota bacterium]
MSPNRAPLIGIVTHSTGAGTPRPGFRCYAAYAQAVADAGGAPVLVPLLQEEPQLDPIHEHIDGLLLTGGPDVNPHRYGEQRRPECGPSDDAMDRVEARLIRWSLEDDRPLLAICRGQQMLNVVGGGALYQDLPSQYPGSLDHAQGERRTELVHDVMVEAGSHLVSIVGAGTFRVNSSHHQAVKEVGRLFVVTARASDGVIEGIESPRHRFALAVQWHPEEIYRQEPRHAALFRALVEAAGRAAAASER